MTDAEREIKRLISYIRSCRVANIDCTVTIDKSLTHGVLNALEEIQQYREIGTVEECREAKRFKEYFDELYGIGLEVANWHQNGDTEPFDNFYDAAIDWSEQNERDM